MLKLLLQTFSLAFPIVVVVLGVMVLLGNTVFLPFLIVALVIMAVLLTLTFLDRKKNAANDG